ncbi:MAG: PAS domain S-box protein [Thermodesulfobacteriota bacterium]|nr:PAS domain S-box protein [Thermodesulfobacteriota bacterium]
MPESNPDNHIIEGAVFADRIWKCILIPLLFGICLVSYIKGIPYPMMPIAIVVVIYYMVAQISIILIKRNFYPLSVYFINLITDILLLTIAIRYSGGIESPVFVLLEITFIRAAIALPLRQAIIIFSVGGAAYLGEIWLEYYRVIPHIHIFTIFKPNVFQDTPYILISTLVIIAVLVGTAVLTVYITKFLHNKLEELSRTKSYADNLVYHLEEAKASLEIKVEERTRELRESEEKYRNIVNKAFDGIFILQDNFFQFFNNKFEEITGYKARDLQNMDAVRIIAPESLELVTQRTRMRLAGENVPEVYEFGMIRKDGKKINVEIYSTTIKYKERPAIQAYIRDVTERNRVEQELRETKEFLESIVESSIDSIVATDNRGFITFSSKGAKEMMGYTDTEISETHVSKYYLGGIEESKKVMGILEKDGKLRNYQTALLSKEKRPVPVNISVSLLKNPKGETIGTLGVFKDITEIKEAENQLKETKDFLENVIESSIDGITTTDNKGYITFASKGAEEMLSYVKKETIGTHISQYYADGIEDAKKIMKVLREKGRLENYETGLIAKGGHIVPVITSASLLKNDASEVIGTLGVYKDITEKRILEEEITRRNEELENFVYTISHDLKSPLVSLQGFASILSSDYNDRIDEKGQHYLDRIKKNANYMESLILDLLELSRVGRVVDTLKEVDTSQIIEEVIGRVQHRLEERNMRLIIGNYFPTVYCDRNRLVQVIENMVTNSIKFMGETEYPIIEIGHGDKGEFHEFYVKDNGIGIEQEFHDKIFRIFQRLQDIEDIEGTGVGLAIAKKIIENHKGRIWVESEKGNGSTFHFTLPKRK